MAKPTKAVVIPGEAIDPLYKGFKFNGLAVRPEGSWILLGPSGGGKESRGKYLLEKFSLFTKLSSGDIFRNQILTGISKPQMDQLKEAGKSLGVSLKKKAGDPSYVTSVFREHGIPYKDENQALAAFQTLNGLFVDDRIFLEYADNQLKEYAGKKIVLDGHIRTQKQVPGILAIAKRYNIIISNALLVHTSLSILEKRTVGRLSCPVAGCKRDYNTTADPRTENYPMNVRVDENGLAWGECHDHKTKLVRRSDDYPDKVRTRLNEYRANIAGVLKELDKAGIPIFVVSGSLNPYSKEEMRKSIDEALACDNQKVLKRF